VNGENVVIMLSASGCEVGLLTEYDEERIRLSYIHSFPGSL
jgi:hypothetical protein